MAIARKWLANHYNRPGFDLFDYNIYAVCGDGCLMEGVGSEAASLAGHLGLDNLCWIYDNNHITIEGKTSITFTEDVAARFLGYGWNVLRVGDANDIERIEDALAVFQQDQGSSDLDHPGQPYRLRLAAQAGHAAAHGEPLGEDEVRLVKRAYGWPEDAKFLVPDGVKEHFEAGIGARGAEARQRWDDALRRLPRASFPSSPPRSTRCSGASCPPAGTATCRASRRTPRASPAATPRARC